VGSGIEAGNKVGAKRQATDGGPVGVGRRGSISVRWRGGVSQLTWVSTRSCSLCGRQEAVDPAHREPGGNATIGSAPGLVGKTTLSLGCQPD
jgi:hypothetical protein